MSMLPQSSSVASAHILGGDSACAHPRAVRAQPSTAHGSTPCACRPATPSSAVGHRARVRGTRALHVPVAFLELRTLNPELRHEILRYVLDTPVDERRAWRAATHGELRLIRRAAVRCTIAGRSAACSEAELRRCGAPDAGGSTAARMRRPLRHSAAAARLQASKLVSRNTQVPKQA